MSRIPAIQFDAGQFDAGKVFGTVRVLDVLPGLRFACVLGLCLPAFGTMAQGKSQSCEKNSEQAAVHYVQELKNQADAILETHNAPLTPMKAHVLANVAFDPLAKFALGRFWNQATPGQRLEYRTLFRQTVLHTLASQVLEFRGGTLEITRHHAVGPTDMLVKSRIVSAKGETSFLDWRIGFRDCRPLAVDLLKGGISMITTKRQEFETVASRLGVDGLLSMLKALAAKQGQQTSSLDTARPHLETILNHLLRETMETLKLQDGASAQPGQFRNRALSLRPPAS